MEVDAESLQKTPTKSYEIKGQPGSHSGKVFVRLSLGEGHGDFEHGIRSGHYQNRAPLLSRAWVFQERCLASRTLHMPESSYGNARRVLRVNARPSTPYQETRNGSSNGSPSTSPCAMQEFEKQELEFSGSTWRSNSQS